MRRATTVPMFLLAWMATACHPAGTPAPARTDGSRAQDAPAVAPTPPKARTAPGMVDAPVAVAPATPAADAPVVEHWQCGDILLDARDMGDAVRLYFSGRALTLGHAESLVGARYADARGNGFVRDGDSATLTLAGGESRTCEPTTRLSPWNDARLRHIAFRATGSEPGWWAEIGGPRRDVLHAVLDYGDRTVEAAELSETPHGYSGRTSTGAPLDVVIARAACQDGMSGEAFEARVRMTVGSRTYTGCGAYLGD